MNTTHTYLQKYVSNGKKLKCVILEIKFKGWGDVSVRKVLAGQHEDLSSNHPESGESYGEAGVPMCLQPWGCGGGDGSSPPPGGGLPGQPDWTICELWA